MRYRYIAIGVVLTLTANACGNHNNLPVPTGSTASEPPIRHAASVSTSSAYAQAVLSNNPVAYYTLGDQNTASAADSSGNGHTGTYNGLGTALTQGTTPLIVNDTTTSTTDNGNSAGSVSAARGSAFENANVSLEAWVVLSGNLGSFQVLAQYGKMPQNRQGYGIVYDGPHSAFALRITLNSGTTLINALVEPTSGIGFKPQNGVTYHLVATYNGSSALLYINGQVAASRAVSGSIAYAPATSTAGLTIFEDPDSDAVTTAKLQEVAFYNTALPASTVAAHYAYGTGTTPPPNPCGPATYTDWSTFGDNLQRTNYNPNETTLTPSNAASLKLCWSRDLGAAITAQPVIATTVSIKGTPTTVAYVGTEGGNFYALNADTGATIWFTALGTVSSGCLDLPGGVFGITGTATFDRATNRIYVADGKDQVHALDMSTGTEAPAPWPVTVTAQFTSNHIYSALTFNPLNGLLYAETASFCDSGSWQGRIVAINTSTAGIVATFYPASPYFGAGIWGIGGVAIAPVGEDVYLATGNTQTSNSANNAPNEYAAYGDHVVRLNGSSLGVVSANYPSLPSCCDQDFGATPMIYTPPGCAQEFTVKNKSGLFLSYYTDSIGSGKIQSLAMAPVSSDGIFIGTIAYSPDAKLVYVGDPEGHVSGSITYVEGLIALAPQANCLLGAAPAWQQAVGPAAANDDNYSATVVRGGVVFFTDGIGKQAFAFNAATGQQLWNSGATITGPTQVAPTVDGRVFVSSWDHHLYAFGK